MTDFQYTPDKEIPVHTEGAIKLLGTPFQSHENGLPEWAKNASDEYLRRDSAPEDRIVVLIFSDAARQRPASISCLDFGGMTTQVIETYFRTWADPDAARQGGAAVGEQGGHGNGGKCYMALMFDDYAVLHTVTEGKGCCYGVPGDSVHFGYIPDTQSGRAFDVADLALDLHEALAAIGSTLSELPAPARELLERSSGFTLVSGVGPKGYRRKIPVIQLVDSLVGHPQMIRTLQLCRVFVVHNGRRLNHGEPLALPEITPMEGAEKPRVIPVPARVKDPASEERISTTSGGSFPLGELVLKTADKSMRYGAKKAQHAITFEGPSGYIGYVPVPELDIQSPYRNRIYGTCRLDALEPYKQNDRSRLAESPLTRGVMRFISYEVQRYAKEFEHRDKREYSREEKSAISRLNEALDRWKNRFLVKLLEGMWGEGGPGPSASQGAGLPSGVPKRLVLSLTCTRMGRNVSTRPSLKFYDASGQRIRPIPVRWSSDDNNVAMVDEDLGIITTFSCGPCQVEATTADGSVRSNTVPIEVVAIREIHITPTEVELAAGSRHRLVATCNLADGSEAEDIALIWTEGNTAIARVTAAGIVFGFAPGETEVTAGDDVVMAERPARVRVVEGDGRGEGNRRGRGYPRVLVSGEIDPDPDTGEAVHFSSDEPPVWQRPRDTVRNIWWINSAAPLAKLYLDTERRYGYHTREWRMYHLERFVDVIVQIALRYESAQQESLSVDEWILNWGSKAAEIQGAAAADLADFLETGSLAE
jgi:hypothetical protein